MRHSIHVLIVLLSWTAAPGIGLADPPREGLDASRRATTLIRVTNAQGIASGGSGILVRVDGRSGFIATSLHVIDAAVGPGRRIEVVLHSGTRDERSVPGSVIATDEGKDLALLKITAADLPAPLPLAAPSALKELDPVCIFGFPFGGTLSVQDANAAVTIGKGAVASIGRNRTREITSIQIEGEVNPGNSGGPITTEKGELVGICAAKIVDTRIGLVIPAEEIRSLFSGRVTDFDLRPCTVAADRVTYDVAAGIEDTFGNLEKVSIRFMKLKKGRSMRTAPTPTHSWPIVSSAMSRADLQIEGDEAHGKLILESAGDTTAEFVVQIEYKSRDQLMVYTKPRELFVHFLVHPIVSDVNRIAADPTVKGAATTTPLPARQDDWLGKPPEKKDASSPAPVNPIVSGTPLEFESRSMRDFRAKILRFENTSPNVDVQWIEESHTAYVLSHAEDGQTKGMIQKLSLPGFLEERRFHLSQRPSGISCCASGLLVKSSTDDVVWLFDPDTLTPIRGYDVSFGMSKLLTSPTANYFITVSDRGYDTVMYLTDLDSGLVTRHSPANLIMSGGGASASNRRNRPSGNLERPTIYANGTRLLWRDGKRIQRAEVSASEIKYIGPGPLVESPNFFLTSDESHLICYSPASFAKDGAVLSLEGYFEYSLDDPTAPPIRRIPGGHWRKSIVCDDDSGIVVATENSVGLLHMDSDWHIRSSLYLPELAEATVIPVDSHGKYLAHISGLLAWLEVDADARDIPSHELPKPKMRQPGQSHATTAAGDANQRTLPFNAMELLPNVVWMDDGSAFFVVDNKGTLLMVSNPGLELLGRLDLGQNCTWIDQCRDGLLLTLADREELWIVDMTQLTVKKRISAPGCRRAISSPALSTAYVPIQYSALGSAYASASGMMSIIDLDAGRIAKQLLAQDLYYMFVPSDNRRERHGFNDFTLGAVTPDGTALLEIDSQGRMARLTIGNNDLACDDIANPNPTRFALEALRISPDSKYVFCGGTAVFRIGDIQTPIVNFEVNAQWLAFDRVSRLLYGVANKELVAFGSDGAVLHHYGDIRENVRGLFASPRGREVLILIKDRLEHWRLPEQ